MIATRRSGLALGSWSGRRRRVSSGDTIATVPPDTADRDMTAVYRLRGGDAASSSSSSSSSGIKGDGKGGTTKEDASWGINLNVFGWGGDSGVGAEAKAEKKRKAKQDMEEAEAREAMRKAREER